MEPCGAGNAQKLVSSHSKSQRAETGGSHQRACPAGRLLQPLAGLRRTGRHHRHLGDGARPEKVRQRQGIRRRDGAAPEKPGRCAQVGKRQFRLWHSQQDRRHRRVSARGGGGHPPRAGSAELLSDRAGTAHHAVGKSLQSRADCAYRGASTPAATRTTSPCR